MPTRTLATAITQQEGIPVVALVRVSTEGQAAEGRMGLERQRATIRRTLDAKQLNCVEWYELVDVSGTNVSNHPTIKKILRRILDGEIKGICIADLDRLFRPDKPEGYAILQVFQDMGANIYSGDYEFDLRTKDGLLFSSIRSAISGFELGLMKERQQGGKEAKRRAGKCPSNELTLPHGIGYDRKTETWHYTPEIGTVIELFRLFDEEGIHNYSELGRRTGLQQASVKVILRNTTYTGFRTIDQRRGREKRTSKSGKQYRLKVARAPEEIIRTKILDGIITEERHKRILAEMERVKFNHRRKKEESQTIHLGAGVCFCGHCGLPIFHVSGKRATETRKAQSGNYICKSHHYVYRKRYDGGCKQCWLRADQLDAAIDTLAATVLRSPAHLGRILEASLAKTRELVTPFAKSVSPSTQVETLRKRDARILAAYEEGVVDITELRTKRDAIRREIETLTRLAEPKAPTGNADLHKLARLIVKAALRYPRLTDAGQKQRIIREIFAELHVRDKAIVSFRFKDAILLGIDEGAISNATILLPKAIRIGPAPDILPAGFRRCLVCREVKPVGEFYKNLNRCSNPCRSQEERQRHLRRRQKSREAGK